MSRIAKADVNQALTLAGKLIVEAGGPDGRISRAELKARLPLLPPAERALVDVFFKFIDARDARPGAQVTKSDVDAAVAYAKEALIAKYDVNGNGLSKDEIAKMSQTGKLAVELARALKAAPIDGPVAPPRIDEGLSEPDEILAAGQVPRDWTPGVALASGEVTHRGDIYTGFTTSQPLTAEQRQVTDAAMVVLWEHVFQHRVGNDAAPLAIGPRANGTLKVGSFTRPDDGKTYLVADWRDIDDASFTLYFERLTSGKLRLAIEQFNN